MIKLHQNADENRIVLYYYSTDHPSYRAFVPGEMGAMTHWQNTLTGDRQSNTESLRYFLNIKKV